jgi:hypothetical protein
VKLPKNAEVEPAFDDSRPSASLNNDSMALACA